MQHALVEYLINAASQVPLVAVGAALVAHQPGHVVVDVVRRVMKQGLRQVAPRVDSAVCDSDGVRPRWQFRERIGEDVQDPVFKLVVHPSPSPVSEVEKTVPSPSNGSTILARPERDRQRKDAYFVAWARQDRLPW